MEPQQKKLKLARAEIEAVLKKHDIGGFVSLSGGAGWGEVFWNIWPSYSILIGDFPSIRIKSKLSDYSGRADWQRADQGRTAQMIHHIGLTTGECAMQFLELANILNAKLGAEHVDRGFIPDPSNLNPGTH